MTLRQNLILLIGLIIFASIVLLVERPFENRKQKVSEEALPLFPDLKLEEVKKVEIKKNNTVTTIRKQDNRWYVAGKEDYPADLDQVERMIKKIQELKKSNLASRKKDKHPLFEVEEGKGLEVSLLGEKENLLARLLIGKTGPDFLSTYIRRADSDEVYLWEEYLRTDFDREVNGWRDRTILEFNPGEVLALSINKAKENENISLTKDTQGNWHLEEPFSRLAENSRVEKLLANLVELRAADFPDEEKELGLSGIDNPTYQISLKLKDNRNNILTIGNKKEDSPYYYVKSDQKKYLFLVYENTVKNLIPEVKELEKAKEASGKEKESEKNLPESAQSK